MSAYDLTTTATIYNAVKTAVNQNKSFDILTVEKNYTTAIQVSYSGETLRIITAYGEPSIFENIEFVVSSKGSIIGLDADGDSIIRILQDAFPLKREDE